jgi:serine/threonine-protein kinase
MTRCQECDSQVAENDLFCPFCGVQIEAAPSASAEAVASSPVDPGFSEATTEPDIEDIPAPAILSEFSKTQDNVDPGPTSEYSISSSDEISAVMVHEASTDEHPVASVAEPLEEPSAEAVEATSDIFEERTAAKDDRISKPLQELEQSDPYASRSMFDSVRIMESKPDDVDTRIQGTSDPMPHVYTPPALADTSNVEPKPYTEPNMGLGGDTDGKRGKLKPLSEGTILNGRYEIVRKIGGGGMGAVYLASDNNLGGVLRAVKEMVQSHIEEEQQEKAINDFKRESMILSTLDHASIPTIYDYFYDADEGRFYLVMKYISGGDLASRLRSAPEGKIDEKSCTQWAIQITDVLDYLHSQPSTIVYRDLKPSNIMLDGNTGRVMLIDFGIARSISQKEEKGVTAVGTMGYAPPELFSGNVEPRSDIYSLGSTMFHLLTGADPQSNPLLIFDFQKNPRPRQINSQLSDQIEQILMKSVEYSADSRFSSAAEMKAALEEHLANLRTGNVTYGVSAAPASISLENQSVFCGFCGQRIVATDLFCAFCGAKQPIAQQGVHSEIYSRSTPTAKLIIEGTSELTTPAFSLQKDENLVGRRDPMSNIFPEIDLSKYDPQTKISRRHARIWRDGGDFLVEDLGSSNGTILATAVSDSLRLVPHKPHVLSSGDRLKVGDTTLHFLIG